MTRLLCFVIALGSMPLSACAPAASPKTERSASARSSTPQYREASARIEAARSVVRELRASVDAGIPRAIAKTAHCIAILPDLVHVGVVIGARAGRGVFMCRGASGWTMPAFVALRGASAGLQAGIQSTDLLLLAMTDEGEAALLKGKMQIGASTSITAGPVGRSAQASDDASLRAPVLYYARSSGLFVGVDLSGTTLEADEESSRAFYGDARDFGVLLRAAAAPPSESVALRDDVARWLDGFDEPAGVAP